MKARIDTKIMNRPNINQLYLKDTSFANLMQKRVFNVLLVASRYDAFIMEEDGRVEEQIYFEYVSLNLSSPPRVKQVTTNEEAFEELALKRRLDSFFSRSFKAYSKGRFEWGGLRVQLVG